ncbi:MAG TPA: lasso peptide biosynthesis B2 protein [Blastocatellia bacterium]|nr:lasso peptide biosynthesis B2 protein [Blastocatellia bacterium]
MKTMITATSRFGISPDACFAIDKDGTTILSIEQGKLYSLIGVGSLVWSMLVAEPAGLPLSVIVDQLQMVFNDTSRRQLEQDVEKFLTQLGQTGVIRVDDRHAGRLINAHGRRIGLMGLFLTRLAVGALLKAGLDTLAALLLLVVLDLVLRLGRFRGLHRTVRQWPRVEGPAPGAETTAQICAAVDRACTWYLKPALCLQRSAVGTCLLRSRGIAAEMAIGCHKMPFHGHAWVEVGGEVVNDHRQVRLFYSTLQKA